MPSQLEEFVQFSVYDNGCGISEDKLDAIKEIIKHQNEEEYNVVDDF